MGLFSKKKNNNDKPAVTPTTASHTNLAEKSSNDCCNEYLMGGVNGGYDHDKFLFDFKQLSFENLGILYNNRSFVKKIMKTTPENDATLEKIGACIVEAVEYKFTQLDEIYVLYSKTTNEPTRLVHNEIAIFSDLDFSNRFVNDYCGKAFVGTPEECETRKILKPEIKDFFNKQYYFRGVKELTTNLGAVTLDICNLIDKDLAKQFDKANPQHIVANPEASTSIIHYDQVSVSKLGFEQRNNYLNNQMAKVLNSIKSCEFVLPMKTLDDGNMSFIQSTNANGVEMMVAYTDSFAIPQHMKDDGYNSTFVISANEWYKRALDENKRIAINQGSAGFMLLPSDYKSLLG